MIAIGVMYLLEMILDTRQLNMYYTKNRPPMIKNLVTKDEFRKC